jgi:hypothetical protein
MRGFALMQAGDGEGARSAFERSLEAARVRDDLLQTALTLDAMARLDRWEGRQSATGPDAEAAAAFGRLGIRQVPTVPLTGRPVQRRNERPATGRS